MKNPAKIILIPLVLLLMATAGNFFITANAATQDDSGIKITLIYGKYKTVYIDKHICATNHLIAEDIHTRRINAGYKEKTELVKKCISSGGSHKSALLYALPLLQKTVEKAIKAVNSSPVDSDIKFNPDSRPMFKITREKAGRYVNEEELYRQIYFALIKNPQPKITIRPGPVPPKITAADNAKLTKLRAKYATGYSLSGENRKHNIRLALSKLSGAQINSGEQFSFNKRVGRRSEAAGYKTGKIIIGGKYEDGIGGGVCQVSTTLYNAALLAGLKITSVRNHSLECSYEKPSFDAMVNSGSSDLKFTNAGDTPVFLRAYGSGDEAVIEIYGEPLNYSIKRISEILFRGQPPEPEVIIDYENKYHDIYTESGISKSVSYSHGELKSRGYLLYYDKNNFLIKKELIREDTYRAVRGLIAIAP